MGKEQCAIYDYEEHAVTLTLAAANTHALQLQPVSTS